MFVWNVYDNDLFIFIVPVVHLILPAYILFAPLRQYEHTKLCLNNSCVYILRECIQLEHKISEQWCGICRY